MKMMTENLFCSGKHIESKHIHGESCVLFFTCDTCAPDVYSCTRDAPAVYITSSFPLSASAAVISLIGFSFQLNLLLFSCSTAR